MSFALWVQVEKMVDPAAGATQESATLVCGQYNPTPSPGRLGFLLEPSPLDTAEIDPVAVTPEATAAHAHAMALENQNYFAGAAPEARYV